MGDCKVELEDKSWKREREDRGCRQSSQKGYSAVLTENTGDKRRPESDDFTGTPDNSADFEDHNSPPEAAHSQNVCDSLTESDTQKILYKDSSLNAQSPNEIEVQKLEEDVEIMGKKSFKSKAFTRQNESCQAKIELLEEKFQEIREIFNQVLKDLKKEKTQREILQAEYAKLAAEVKEKDELLERMHFATVSKGVVDEFSALNIKCDMETEAAKKAMKRATRILDVENSVIETISLLNTDFCLPSLPRLVPPISGYDEKFFPNSSMTILAESFSEMEDTLVPFSKKISGVENSVIETISLLNTDFCLHSLPLLVSPISTYDEKKFPNSTMSRPQHKRKEPFTDYLPPIPKCPEVLRNSIIYNDDGYMFTDERKREERILQSQIAEIDYEIKQNQELLKKMNQEGSPAMQILSLSSVTCELQVKKWRKRQEWKRIKKDILALKELKVDELYPEET